MPTVRTATVAILERRGRGSERVETAQDSLLMSRVRDGDVGTLAVLFERHHRALFQFFVRVTANREASEDLVQDVFFRILKYRETYQPGSQFTGSGTEAQARNPAAGGK
jgi:Sigma-70 region 2